MSVDWDGKSAWIASASRHGGVIALQEHFDIIFANDPDTDRHGIVTRSADS